MIRKNLFFGLMCLLIPLVSAAQGTTTIHYDTDSICDDESYAEASKVRIFFGTGFNDSVKVEQDSLSCIMRVTTNHVLGGAEETISVKRTAGYITISEMTGVYTTKVMVNPAYGVICLNRKGSAWDIYYSNCPPVLE